MADDAVLAHVLASVAARLAVDARERESIARFGAEVARLERPFDEDADSVHITGSALIVGRRGILLLVHRRLGMWMQPGGHVDPGETPWEAARREAVEETGIDVRYVDADPDRPPDLAHVDVHAGGRGHTHLDLRYLFGGGDADPSPPPHESQRVRWFGWEEALAVADVALVGIVAELAKYRRVQG